MWKIGVYIVLIINIFVKKITNINYNTISYFFLQYCRKIKIIKYMIKEK